MRRVSGWREGGSRFEDGHGSGGEAGGGRQQFTNCDLLIARSKASDSRIAKEVRCHLRPGSWGRGRAGRGSQLGRILEWRALQGRGRPGRARAQSAARLDNDKRRPTLLPRNSKSKFQNRHFRNHNSRLDTRHVRPACRLRAWCLEAGGNSILASQ